MNKKVIENEIFIFGKHKLNGDKYITSNYEKSLKTDVMLNCANGSVIYGLIPVASAILHRASPTLENLIPFIPSGLSSVIYRNWFSPIFTPVPTAT